MEGNKFENEMCELKCATLKNEIKNLEIRVFETLKKITQLSDMSHGGHKESLKMAIISIQKDFEASTKEFKNIGKAIDKMEQKLTSYDKVSTAIKEDNIAIKTDLKTELTKVKFLTKLVCGLTCIIILYIITGEDLSKVISFIMTIFTV